MSGNGHRPNGTVERPPGDQPEQTAVRREGERTFRFRRRGTGRGGAGSGANASRGESVELLRAELMLLREENARLAQAHHQPPGVAGLLRQAHVTRVPEAIAHDSADELVQLMTDYAVMRETLLLACDEMESSLAALRARLAALPTALAPADPHPASNGNGSAGAAAVLIGIDKGALQ
jgi:hypothetical protein